MIKILMVAGPVLVLKEGFLQSFKKTVDGSCKKQYEEKKN
jgi:hypothetical protein